MRRDLYAEVSARIVAELERGAAPWIKPWSVTAGANTPCNAVTNRPYSGCNVILLWLWRVPPLYPSDSRARGRQRDPLGPAPGRRRQFHFSSPSGLAGPAAHETLLICGRVVGTEVGFPLVQLMPARLPYWRRIPRAREAAGFALTLGPTRFGTAWAAAGRRPTSNPVRGERSIMRGRGAGAVGGAGERRAVQPAKGLKDQRNSWFVSLFGAAVQPRGHRRSMALKDQQ